MGSALYQCPKTLVLEIFPHKLVRLFTRFSIPFSSREDRGWSESTHVLDGRVCRGSLERLELDNRGGIPHDDCALRMDQRSNLVITDVRASLAFALRIHHCLSHSDVTTATLTTTYRLPLSLSLGNPSSRRSASTKWWHRRVLLISEEKKHCILLLLPAATKSAFTV